MPKLLNIMTMQKQKYINVKFTCSLELTGNPLRTREKKAKTYLTKS